MALAVKNLPANAEDLRGWGSVPGSGGAPEKGMATHSSILAWRLPWTEEPRATSNRVARSPTGLTEQLSMQAPWGAPGCISVSLQAPFGKRGSATNSDTPPERAGKERPREAAHLSYWLPRVFLASSLPANFSQKAGINCWKNRVLWSSFFSVAVPLNTDVARKLPFILLVEILKPNIRGEGRQRVKWHSHVYSTCNITLEPYKEVER